MRFKRSGGLLLHPTSFPSKYGIGDLGLSAYEFIDFLKRANQTIWQILPLGPTSFGDSPYQSFSTFAGNTLMISPEILIEEGYIVKSDLKEIPDFDPISIDYNEVSKYKSGIYKKAYQNFKISATDKQKAAYNKFCLENIYWLEDYSLFISLKEHFIEERKPVVQISKIKEEIKSSELEEEIESLEFKEFKTKYSKILKDNAIKDYYFGAVWSTWPDELVNRQISALDEWKKKLSEKMRYYKFLQYEFFRQWNKLKKYANANNIKIIGDIPIFVAYDSADTWANPDLFYLNKQGFPTVVAGVPPDYFSVTGQLWGNPLYKWENHKKTHYKWWIDRISNSFKSLDILRIDHFRGFDEYWEVPFSEETAVKGKWKKGPGKELFTAIKKALGELPIIAEDLGLLTDSVEQLRDYFNFPGMKILQFAFLATDEKAENDYLPHNLVKNAVVYSGTHDNDTTKGWYSKSDNKDKDVVRRYINVNGENISWDFIRLAYSTVCDIAIVTMQDVMELDSQYRMNTPGTPSGNWKWRYTKNMLLNEYAEKLKYLSKLFGRY